MHEFIQSETKYHLTVHNHSKISTFFNNQNSIPNIAELKNEFQKNNHRYDLSTSITRYLIAKPNIQADGEKTLKTYIAEFEKYVERGNVFFAYALAVQLELGIAYQAVKNSHYIELRFYKNLNKSYQYWKFLKSKGYDVDEDLIRVEQQLSNFDLQMNNLTPS